MRIGAPLSGRGRDFFFFTGSKSGLGPTLYPIQWVAGPPSAGMYVQAAEVTTGSLFSQHFFSL